MSPRLRAYTLLLIVSAIWGIAGPVIKFTLTELPPSIFLLYRFAIASVFSLLTLPFLSFHLPHDTKGKLKVFIYCFLTTTISLGLLFLGFDKTSSISGSTINAIHPLIVTLAGVLFLKEHVTKREQLGLAISLIGTGIIIIEPLIYHSADSSLTGNILIVLSLFVGVALAILAKLILRNSLTPFTLTQLSFLVGFITTIPFVLAYHSPSQIFQSISSISISTHLGVWYMALISGTLAYTLWHRGQKTIETGETAMFAYTYPLFAAPFSLLWLHEKITPSFIVGAIIIAMGIILAETKNHK